MKNKTLMAFIIGAGLISCNSSDKKNDTQTEAPIIEKVIVNAENGLMTPEILYSFGRISDAQISPDKSKVLYGVTYVSIEQNKTNRELFVMNTDGSDKKQITRTPKSENNAIWIKGGTKIAFLSSENGSSQIWEMNPDGTDRKQISKITGDINGFSYSPDEKRVMYIKNIKFGERTADRYSDLPKASGRIIDDLMYKHWSEWIEEIPHTFVTDYNNGNITDGIDILKDEPYECPMLPFGGMEQLAWSPDNKYIAYTCRKKKGIEYALSTNSDIYLYDIQSQETTNLTEGMMGYDTNPVFSPDGNYIAWQSMERDGYESDKNRLFVMNLSTKEKIYVTEKFDYNTDYIVWNDDNQGIYFLSGVEARTHIYKAYIHTKEISQITKGDYDYESFSIAGDKLIALRHSSDTTRID